MPARDGFRSTLQIVICHTEGLNLRALLCHLTVKGVNRRRLRIVDALALRLEALNTPTQIVGVRTKNFSKSAFSLLLATKDTTAISQVLWATGAQPASREVVREDFSFDVPDLLDQSGKLVGLLRPSLLIRRRRRHPPLLLFLLLLLLPPPAQKGPDNSP